MVKPPPAAAAADSTDASGTPAAQRAAARGASAADRAERAAKAVAAVKAAAAATAAQQQRQRAQAVSQGSFVSSVSSAMNSSSGAGSGRGFRGVAGRDGEGDNGARRNSSRPRGDGGDREGAPWQDRWREGRGFPPRSPGGWGAPVGGRFGGRFGRGGLGRGASATSRGESIRKGFSRGSGAFEGEGRRLGGTGTRPIPSRGGGQRGGESGRQRLEREKSDRAPR